MKRGMEYPIKAREGNNILTVDGNSISLNEINDNFRIKSIQSNIDICKKLGITIESDDIIVTFEETGKAYSDPKCDRTQIESNETSSNFSLTFNCKNATKNLPLDFTINLKECSNQKYINFYGEICVTLDSQNITRKVPLTGRGTAALEGRENDAHAGLCTGGACAAFQQKVAIFSSVLGGLNVLTRDMIEIFRTHLNEICDKYHGRNDILNYTIDKAFGLTELCYFDYMLNLHADDLPIMTQHFNEYSEPHPNYFIKLKSKLTPEEQAEEMKILSVVKDGKVSENIARVINNFISIEELFITKSFPGENLSNIDNGSMSIAEVAKCINSDDITKIKHALEQMGVIIYDDIIKIQFYFKGRKIDSNTNNEESEESFEIELKRRTKDESLTQINIQLNISPMWKINFFGKLTISNGFVIPLIGRGTLDINASGCDTSTFCIDGKFAAFQQKVAILYSVLYHKFNVDVISFNKFHDRMLTINRLYFKRSNIIEYSFLTVKGEVEIDYFQYCQTSDSATMKEAFALNILTNYDRYPARFYEELVNCLTEEEILSEYSRQRSQINIFSKIKRNIFDFFSKIF